MKKVLLLTIISSILFLSACSGATIADDISEQRHKKLAEAATESLKEAKDATKSEEVPNFIEDSKVAVEGLLHDDSDSDKQSNSNNISSVTYKYNYDGDTITFIANDTYNYGTSQSDKSSVSWKKGEEIKLRHLLIDTTEMKDYTTGQPQEYAEEAKEYTEKLLSHAKKIELIFDEGDKLDKYDRKLAYVRIDGELLGVKLLERGLAKIRYVEEPNTMYLKEFRAAEKKAKAKRLNLWSNK